MLSTSVHTHRLAASRMDRVSDDAGGWLEEWVELGTVEGSLQPAGAVETIVAEAQRVEARWLLFVDPGADLQRDDRLTLTSVLSVGSWLTLSRGRAYVVRSVAEWRDGGTLDHDVFELEEVQRGR